MAPQNRVPPRWAELSVEFLPGKAHLGASRSDSSLENRLNAVPESRSVRFPGRLREADRRALGITERAEPLRTIRPSMGERKSRSSQALEGP
jgi:hypothetical protein